MLARTVRRRDIVNCSVDDDQLLVEAESFGAKTASQYHDRMPSLAAAFLPRNRVVTDRSIFLPQPKSIGVRKVADDGGSRVLGNCLGLLVWGLGLSRFPAGGRFTCASLILGGQVAKQKVLVGTSSPRVV